MSEEGVFFPLFFSDRVIKTCALSASIILSNIRIIISDLLDQGYQLPLEIIGQFFLMNG
jgi:hypothetical protein